VCSPGDLQPSRANLSHSAELGLLPVSPHPPSGEPEQAERAVARTLLSSTGLFQTQHAAGMIESMRVSLAT